MRKFLCKTTTPRDYSSHFDLVAPASFDAWDSQCPPVEPVSLHNHHFIPAPVSQVQVTLDSLLPVHLGPASTPPSLRGPSQTWLANLE